MDTCKLTHCHLLITLSWSGLQPAPSTPNANKLWILLTLITINSFTVTPKHTPACIHMHACTHTYIPQSSLQFGFGAFVAVWLIASRCELYQQAYHFISPRKKALRWCQVNWNKNTVFATIVINETQWKYWTLFIAYCSLSQAAASWEKSVWKRQLTYSVYEFAWKTTM